MRPLDPRRHRQLLAVLAMLALSFLPHPARAHEVLPAIASFSVKDGTLKLAIRADIDAIMAGLDLSSEEEGAPGPEDGTYDALRVRPASEIAVRFRTFWPGMADQVRILVDGVNRMPVLTSVVPPEADVQGLSRSFTVNLVVDLPPGARTVSIGWAEPLGPLVLRQNGVESPYDGYLEPGQTSPPVALAGGDAQGGWSTFAVYVPVGFQHIVPLGLDHILFVLGLFLFDTRLRPLLLQISAFTAAHTLTLAAAAAEVITIPASVVEPAIAASIVFVAVENIFGKGRSALRLPLVFLFGLLHGLGFASVLAEFGLPETGFLAALLGFNLGVEIGQLAVVGAAFLCVSLWFRRHALYRAVVVVPGSVVIGLTGAVWFVQRLT